jgi:hypothetical protein
MFRYSHISPITRHNNVHYPLQDVIRDKAWQKKKIKKKEKERQKKRKRHSTSFFCLIAAVTNSFPKFETLVS